MILVIVLYDNDGLMQHCCNSNANALKLLQSCTEPLVYIRYFNLNGHHNSLMQLQVSVVGQDVRNSSVHNILFYFIWKARLSGKFNLVLNCAVPMRHEGCFFTRM